MENNIIHKLLDIYDFSPSELSLIKQIAELAFDAGVQNVFVKTVNKARNKEQFIKELFNTK
jgi:CO dehydrogenase nickel-insertion accessory protein CooC1